VIGNRKIGHQPPGSALSVPKSRKGLRGGDLVQQLPVDINQRRAIVRLADQVIFPKLVV